jgi:hypothetical protein
VVPAERHLCYAKGMNVAVKIPVRMNVAEFLAWCPEDGPAWQLIGGDGAAKPYPRRGPE